MSTDASLQFRPPAFLRGFPADLTILVVVVVATWVAMVLPDEPVAVAIRGLLAVAFVLLAPGYALVSALYPAAPDTDQSVDSREDPDNAERLTFAIGTSIVVAPLVALGIHFSPFVLSLGSVLVSLSVVTLSATVVAAARRASLPGDERYESPEILTDPFQNRAIRPVDVIVAVAVLGAGASLAYAAAEPRVGESFSEFYLLAEAEDGTLIADNYPSQFELGESKPMVVGIENREGSQQAYTVVVLLQDVDDEGVVTEQRELDRFRANLEDDETWRLEHEVSPSFTGRNLRLTYLLYYNDPPADPTFENADDHVHVWVTVSEPTMEA
ncbi:hypothetical protein C455_06401 [Haloferax larsenii JCM 13917]|nr:DUF1616 domain-containing protein [Haloferax larsenii]ELZ80480.1 hypothetical protein C455_06401 [Haloferax larsenii JCM 13917]